MVLQTPGFDSWTAMGLMGEADGIVESLTYDGLYGQGVLRINPCPRPRGLLSAEGFVLIDCDSAHAHIRMQPTRHVSIGGAR
jgi:hypothetical protein